MSALCARARWRPWPRSSKRERSGRYRDASFQTRTAHCGRTTSWLAESEIKGGDRDVGGRACRLEPGVARALFAIDAVAGFAPARRATAIESDPGAADGLSARISVTGRGSRESFFTGRGSRGSLTGRGSHGSFPRDADHADLSTGRGSHGSFSRDADHSGSFTGRGSRGFSLTGHGSHGFSHGTRITRISLTGRGLRGSLSTLFTVDADHPARDADYANHFHGTRIARITLTGRATPSGDGRHDSGSQKLPV